MNFDPFRAMGPMGLPAKVGFELGQRLGRRLVPQSRPPQPPPQQPQQRPPQTPPRHPSSARTATFQDVAPLSPRVQELYRAILAYPNTQATPAQARQIAIETDAASRAFGIPSKVMLAILAHESQGFNPRAESSTGADGLGQLTGIAVQEMRRLSYDPTYATSYPNSDAERQHYSDPEIQALVERPDMQATFQRLARGDESRYNIRDNIWGSAFYARIAMDRADTQGGAAVVLGADGMMGRYNGASLSERRAHSAGIASAYRSMFSQTIPATLRPQV